MKRLQHVLTIAAIAFTAATSFAGYDEFECRSSGLALKNMQLECVSCGAQKYFAGKAGDREVVPSEKWLALLGTMAVQHAKLDPSGKNKISANSEARENYQKMVISMIKDYGFCQKYINKDWAKKSNDKSSDIAPDEWREIYEGLTHNANMDYKALKKVGTLYGFSGSMFGWNSAENMNYLIMNSPDPTKSNNESDFGAKYPTYNVGQNPAERRPAFVKRLKQALQSEYDVSGERKVGGDRIVESGDKDHGLTECLKELEKVHEGKGDPLLNSFMQSSAEGGKFCREMANSCEIETDFCGSEGAKTPRPKTTTPPPPPPPPAKARSGTGVK